MSYIECMGAQNPHVIAYQVFYLLLRAYVLRQVSMVRQYQHHLRAQTT
jgi:hypothetical protein